MLKIIKTHRLLQKYQFITLSRLKYIAVFGTFTVPLVWGFRVTYDESFRNSTLRGYSGDFNVVMFGNSDLYWDKKSIYYGPVFSIQRKLVDLWPDTFTIFFFAYLNFILVLLSFVFCALSLKIKVIHLMPFATLWVCFQPFQYALSVSANPEIIELTLLCLAWYLHSKGRLQLSIFAVCLAVLTKAMPAIFLLIFILQKKYREIVWGLLFGLSTTVVLGYAMGLHPWESIHQTIVPTARGAETVSLLSWVRAYSESLQLVGLNNALARVVENSNIGLSSTIIQTISSFLTISILVSGTLGLFFISRREIDLRFNLDLSYIFYFFMMPLVTLLTHPHTFVFLLPALMGFISFVLETKSSKVKLVFLTIIVILFSCIAIPTIPLKFDSLIGRNLLSPWVYQDPIWVNIILLLILCIFSVVKARGHIRKLDWATGQ